MDKNTLKTLRKNAVSTFEGSIWFFEACWKELLFNHRQGAYDSFEQWRVNMELDAIASQKVNNPNSKFYMYG